jgi:hypothetical protein
MRHIQLVVALFCVIGATGCAGTKFNLGYDFVGQKFFAEIERPLDPSFKK